MNSDASTAPRRHAALFVTTVPITLEAFLVPFAEHFRAQGWRVDALANGATANARIADAFDNRFDVAWSRNPLDPRNLSAPRRRFASVVEAGGYDIVHVHTPIAAFVTRYALRGRAAQARARRSSTPPTASTSTRAARRSRNALYRAWSALAAPWTDYLVTINARGLRGGARASAASTRSACATSPASASTPSATRPGAVTGRRRRRRAREPRRRRPTPSCSRWSPSSRR